MYYKATGAIGIATRGKDKKQIFQFKSASGTVGEEKMREWADDVLNHLDIGKSEKEVYKWITSQMGKL